MSGEELSNYVIAFNRGLDNYLSSPV